MTSTSTDARHLTVVPATKAARSRASLTEAKVRAAQPRAKRYEVADADVPGLHLVVGATSKVYLLRGRIGTGRGSPKVSITLGDVRVMSLRQARDAARAALIELRAGRDPRRPQVGQVKVDDALDLYEADMVAKGRVRTRDIMVTLRTHLHPRRARPVGDLTRTDITEPMADLIKAGKPGASEWFRKSAVAFLNWCVNEGHLNRSPMHGYRKATSVMSTAKDQWAMTSDDELRRFLEVTTGIDNPIFCAFVRFALMTGQRRSEISGARWSEIDWHAQTWTIPASRMKSVRGKPRPAHVVPLGLYALALLRNLAKITGASANDLIFPSLRSGGEMSGWSKMIAPIRKAYGDDRLSLHGLRRSFRTGLSTLDIDHDCAELCLAHARPGIHGTYDKSTRLDARRAAHEAWESHLAALVDGRL